MLNFKFVWYVCLHCILSGQGFRLKSSTAPRDANAQPTTRANTACWLRDHKVAFESKKIFVGVIGADGNTGREHVYEKYIQRMMESKIVVTHNPSGWEGDRRLGEALASGALVFCDRMADPPDNLKNGSNVIFYDSHLHLEQLLKWALSNLDEANAIAIAGKASVRTYGQLADSILDEIGRAANVTDPVPVHLFGYGSGFVGGADLSLFEGFRTSERAEIVSRENASVILLPIWRMFAVACNHKNSCMSKMMDEVLHSRYPGQRLVALDWEDAPVGLVRFYLNSSDVQVAFKRSRADRNTRKVLQYSRKVFPMYYPTFDEVLAVRARKEQTGAFHASLHTRPWDVSMMFNPSKCKKSKEPSAEVPESVVPESVVPEVQVGGWPMARAKQFAHAHARRT